MSTGISGAATDAIQGVAENSFNSRSLLLRRLRLLSCWPSTLDRVAKMDLSLAESNLDASKPSSLHPVALDKTPHPSDRA